MQAVQTIGRLISGVRRQHYLAALLMTRHSFSGTALFGQYGEVPRKGGLDNARLTCAV